jgi:hypothetical protein
MFLLGLALKSQRHYIQIPENVSVGPEKTIAIKKVLRRDLSFIILLNRFKA